MCKDSDVGQHLACSRQKRKQREKEGKLTGTDEVRGVMEPGWHPEHLGPKILL